MNERFKELAEQAGAKELGADLYGGEFIGAIRLDFLEKFAELIAAKEREACIEIAEKQRYAMHISLTSHPPQNGTAVGIANQIRARGQAEDKNT
jgi:hypothetical protein